MHPRFSAPLRCRLTGFSSPDTSPMLSEPSALPTAERLFLAAASGERLHLTVQHDPSSLLAILLSAFALALQRDVSVQIVVARDATLRHLETSAQKLAQILAVPVATVTSTDAPAQSATPCRPQVGLTSYSVLARHLSLLERTDLSLLPLPDVALLLEAERALPLLQTGMGFSLSVHGLRLLLADLPAIGALRLASRLASLVTQLEQQLLAAIGIQSHLLPDSFPALRLLSEPLEAARSTFLAAAQNQDTPLIFMVRAERALLAHQHITQLLNEPLSFHLSVRTHNTAPVLKANRADVATSLNAGLLDHVESLCVLSSLTDPAELSLLAQHLGLTGLRFERHTSDTLSQGGRA